LLVLLAGLGCWRQAGAQPAEPRPIAVPQLAPPVSANPPPAAPAAAAPAAAAPAADSPNSSQDLSIHVEKIGPSAINVGQPLHYDIVVKNVGPVPLFQVRVEESIPAGARFVRAEPQPDFGDQKLIWNLGHLDAGGERRFHVELQPMSEMDLQAGATVSFATTAWLRTRVTRPRLTIIKTGPETALVGDPVVFQIQITNTGTGPATSVVLHDELPPGLVHEQGSAIEGELGTLAPGETRTVTLPTRAVQPGRHLNQATVTAEGGIRETAQAAVTVTQPALQVRKSGPQRRFVHREVEFDLEVFNPGSGPATNVVVIDTLPEGLDFVSATNGGSYDPASRRITWTLPSLPAGQRQGLSLQLMARKVGDWVNRLTATADRGLQAQAESRLLVEGVPALMLEVVDLDDPVELNNITTYEIRVVNQGSSACTGVQIHALVPSELAPYDAEGPSPHRIQGQVVRFDPLPHLAARADALFRVKVRAVRPGDVRFKVQLFCEQLQGPVHEEESTRLYNDGP
jgi:uncharacterized repeat protein (TIGR01451 family)